MTTQQTKARLHALKLIDDIELIEPDLIVINDAETFHAYDRLLNAANTLLRTLTRIDAVNHAQL